MVIVRGIKHEFKSRKRLIWFHIALIPLGKEWMLLFSLWLCVNSRIDWFVLGNQFWRRENLNSNILITAKNWPCVNTYYAKQTFRNYYTAADHFRLESNVSYQIPCLNKNLIVICRLFFVLLSRINTSV